MWARAQNSGILTHWDGVKNYLGNSLATYTKTEDMYLLCLIDFTPHFISSGYAQGDVPRMQTAAFLVQVKS